MRRRRLLAAGVSTIMAAPHMLVRANPVGRVVVGFPGGTPTDLLARTVVPALEKVLGHTVIVENKPGAGGRFAPKAVYTAKPEDPVFAVLPSGPMTLFPHVFRNLDYKTTLTPLARLLDADLGLAVSPKLPIRTMNELAEWSRTLAGRGASFSSSGVGSILHFLGVGVSRALGVDWTHVPYSGPAQVYSDLSTGTLHMAFGTVPSWVGLAKEGRLRVLAVTGPQRYPRLPDVPTLRESGIDIAVTAWYGLYGPPGFPSERTAEIARNVKIILEDPKLAERLLPMGQLSFGGPDKLAAVQAAETELWARLVKESGFRPMD